MSSGRWDDDTVREGEIKELMKKYGKWIDGQIENNFQTMIQTSMQLTPIEFKILGEVLFELRKNRK